MVLTFKANAGEKNTISIPESQGGKEILQLLQTAKPSLAVNQGVLKTKAVRCLGRLDFSLANCRIQPAAPSLLFVSHLTGKEAGRLMEIIYVLQKEAFPERELHETGVKRIECSLTGDCQVTIAARERIF